MRVQQVGAVIRAFRDGWLHRNVGLAILEGHALCDDLSLEKHSILFGSWALSWMRASRNPIPKL